MAAIAGKPLRASAVTHLHLSRTCSGGRHDRFCSQRDLSARHTMHVKRDALFLRGWAAPCAAMTVRMLGILLLSASPSAAQDSRGTSAATGQPCVGDNGGITLPPGFCATVFADNIGHARQMVVAPNGVVYVNTWSGTYYRNDTPPPGGFLLALQDTTGDGRADAVLRFGAAMPAAPESRFIRAHSMQRRTIAS